MSVAQPCLTQFQLLASFVQIIEDKYVCEFWKETYFSIAQDVHVLALLYNVRSVDSDEQDDFISELLVGDVGLELVDEYG